MLGGAGAGAILTTCVPRAEEARADEASVRGAGHIQSRLGLQLFTVRKPLQEDLEGTLSAIAGIGYREVEMFGFGGNAFIKDPLFGKSATEMRRLLDRLGLSVQCTQISARLPDVGPIADIATALGIRYLIVAMPAEFLTITPSGPVVSGVKDADQIKTIADDLNTLGATCKSHGLRLGYHNHHMEFAMVGSERAYDLLLERTDPGLVWMELDVGWVTAGGANPAEYLARYAGRFVSCHLKDFAPDRTLPAGAPAPIPDMLRMVAPGDGRVDFAAVLREMDRQGIEHGFVESDLPDDPFDVARRGFTYLTNLKI
jgi:sugar phosphate isomerase/epimerase